MGSTSADSINHGSKVFGKKKKNFQKFPKTKTWIFPILTSSYLLSLTLDLYSEQFRDDIEYMQGCSWIICKYYVISCKWLVHLWILVLCWGPGTNSLWIHMSINYNGILEREIKKATSFTIASERIKFLEANLVKEVKGPVCWKLWHW